MPIYEFYCMIAARYLDALHLFIQSCQSLGREVFVLNHEGKKDHELCLKLCGAFDPPLPYTGDRTAKEVKGIIGASVGGFTSRFHGLVSALTQGVPVLATSWSHKYEMLLKDFDASDCLVDLQQDRESLQRQ
ncbi:MAG: polysaccharide pyruvyl transferase family protein, partial [Desulfatiglandaceae bacterium]